MSGSGVNTGPAGDEYAPIGSINKIDEGSISQSDFTNFLQSSAGNGYSKKDFNISTQTFLSHDDEKKVLGTNYGTSSAVDAFNAWKAQQDQGNKDHQAYLDAVKAAPGRQGTILVPAENANDPALLTGAQKKPRTVIG